MFPARSIFHVSMRERALRKCLHRGAPFRNTEGRWLKVTGPACCLSHSKWTGHIFLLPVVSWSFRSVHLCPWQTINSCQKPAQNFSAVLCTSYEEKHPVLIKIAVTAASMLICLAAVRLTVTSSSSSSLSFVFSFERQLAAVPSCFCHNWKDTDGLLIAKTVGKRFALELNFMWKCWSSTWQLFSKFDALFATNFI